MKKNVCAIKLFDQLFLWCKNWKCSTKEAALWKNPHKRLFRWRQCRLLCGDFVIVVNGFHPLILNKKHTTNLWIIRKNFSIALFRTTCIFKYFNCVEISNLETVTNEFFDGLECHFYVEYLKFPLFCNTFICKLKVFGSPRLLSLLRLYNVWTSSRKKRTKGLEIVGQMATYNN